MVECKNILPIFTCDKSCWNDDQIIKHRINYHKHLLNAIQIEYVSTCKSLLGREFMVQTWHLKAPTSCWIHSFNILAGQSFYIIRFFVPCLLKYLTVSEIILNHSKNIIFSTKMLILQNFFYLQINYQSHFRSTVITSCVRISFSNPLDQRFLTSCRSLSKFYWFRWTPYC